MNKETELQNGQGSKKRGKKIIIGTERKVEGTIGLSISLGAMILILRS